MLRMQGFNYIKVNFLSFEMNHLNKKQFEFVISTLTLTQITANKTIWIERKRRRRTKPTKGQEQTDYDWLILPLLLPSPTS